MREKTTKKQQELLLFINDFLNQHNYAPSYREVMAQLGYKSVSTVAVHVDGLIAKGYLTKHDKSARSIRIAMTSLEPKVEMNHLAWLHTQITRLESTDANPEQIEILRKAEDILKG